MPLRIMLTEVIKALLTEAYIVFQIYKWHNATNFPYIKPYGPLIKLEEFTYACQSFRLSQFHLHT